MEVATASLVFVIINYIICTASLFSLYYLRDVQPIKARSMVLLIAWVISIAIDSTFLFLKMYFGVNCLRDLWLDYVGSNALLFLIALRAARLLLVFNVTKSRLEDYKEKEERRQSWWIRAEYAQEPFLQKVVAILVLALVLVPAIASIYVASQNDLAVACRVTWPVTLKYISMGIAILIVIILAIQLRKVHDGFYLKDEFRILACFGLFVVIPFVIVFAAIVPNEGLADISSLAAMTVVLVISYVIPILKAWKTHFEVESAASNNSSTETTMELSEAGPVSVERPFFVKFPHISKLMVDPEVYEFLNAYILHYQEIKQSDYLVFWLQIREFRKIENKEFLAGKAYLLFQKYLKRDGYRHINCVTDEQLSQIESSINEAMKEDGPPLEPTFFEDVFEQLEAEMAEYLFPGFMSSKFFAEYKKATRLKMNLETVIVK